MDEKEKELQEFSLEDIMKEFSDGPEQDPEEVMEFQRQTPSQVQEPQEEPVPVVPAQEGVTGDTVSLERIGAVKAIRENLERTQRFEPVGQDQNEEPEPEQAARRHGAESIRSYMSSRLSTCTFAASSVDRPGK